MSEDKIIIFIRDLASAIGTARAEFEKASREASMGISSTSTNPVNAEQTRDNTGDYLLIDTARKIGIKTEGKTREEISREIIEKFKTQT